MTGPEETECEEEAVTETLELSAIVGYRGKRILTTHTNDEM